MKIILIVFLSAGSLVAQTTFLIPTFTVPTHTFATPLLDQLAAASPIRTLIGGKPNVVRGNAYELWWKSLLRRLRENGPSPALLTEAQTFSNDLVLEGITQQAIK